ncbi:hypothetical protein LIER_34618 [Lithospermum erythrorhizon]|uniref:LOB domain-containing protein n=1 Tax=Lithospermum erythrorhizon TaxID=34254 RepID=A0AAV3S2C5_LITER
MSSCQGCRVLRKGCNQDCVLRDCIQWIPNPQSQANATMFLAKFYGRTGLVNLIEPVHPTMRPDLCKSLLFEACGRIMNPIYGSLGMFSPANWASCQAAVERVLEGQPILQFSVSNEGVSAQSVMPLEGSDIRHISRERNATRPPRTNKKSKKSQIDEGKSPIVGPGDNKVAKEPIKNGRRGWTSVNNPKGRGKFEIGSSSKNYDGSLELTLAQGFPPSEVIEVSDSES